MLTISSPCLNHIRPAKNTDKVFKEECVFSFDNPESENGLYVCLSTFLSIGQRHLSRFNRIYKSQLFLNIKRIRVKCQQDQTSSVQEPTPTKLAIGVPGGFSLEHELFDIKEDFHIVFYEDGREHVFALDNKDLPKLVVDCAKSIIQSESCLLKMIMPDDGNAGWSGELRVESRYSKDLKQINEGRKISPSGWQCEKCELRSNLWLNLSDGSIMCGRRFFDGTGGNNHALEHYKQTGFPLAVKLGTIGDGSNPDVYSYPEDDMVVDTYLDKHLSFFGINTLAMEKTEKSILEMEIDLNRQLDSKWASSRILESDKELEFVSGKGLTPIYNIGSSCYMNAVLQVLFNTDDFQQRYFKIYNEILDSHTIDDRCPIDNLEIQLAKMADGLLSGEYCPSSNSSQKYFSIRPYMLKNALCKSHKEFSTMKQQDASEFFLYCMQEIKRNHFKLCNAQKKMSQSRLVDPTNQFRFLIENRSEYLSTNKCCYTESEEYIIQLPIEVNRLTLNLEEVLEYNEKCDLLKQEGKDPCSLEVVEPIISLLDCFDEWIKDDIIENALLPGCTQPNQRRDILKKRVRFKTFPNQLAIATQRFAYNEDWTPKKLKVCICAPNELDLEHLRGKGPLPGEMLYEKEFGLTNEQEVIAKELQEFGFSIAACKTAVSMSKTKEEAIELLVEKGETLCNKSDSKSKSKSNVQPNAAYMQILSSMGFTEEQSKKALLSTDNHIDRAIDWLFNHADSDDVNVDSQNPADVPINDGIGKYKLRAFISHIGSSAMSGHYVVHILKKFEDNSEKWVIFDDERVAISENPPIKYGYIYFYERT